MGSVWIYVVVVFVGIALGYALPVRFLPPKAMSLLQQASLYVLMVLMGIKLGADESLFKYIATVGLQALCLCLAAISGSVAMVKLIESTLFRNRRIDLYYEDVKLDSAPPWKMSLAVLFFIAFGVTLARLLPRFRSLIMPSLNMHVTIWLSAMIFTAGVEVGRRRTLLEDVKRSGWGLLMLPLCIIVGSIASTAIISPFLRLSIPEGAAVGSACGWYSLSGVMLAEVTPRLGALAFLTNLMREILSLFITPFIAKKFGPFAAVAPGAATAMDTLLPVIIKSTNPSNAIVAFVTGFSMTFFVPAMLSFFINIIK